MTILFSLLTLLAPAAHSGECVPELTVDLDLRVALLVNNVLEFGERRYRGVLIEEFSRSRGLYAAMPAWLSGDRGPNRVPKLERELTNAERFEFKHLIADTLSIPMAWRLRATQAFLNSIGDGPAYAPTPLDPELYRGLRESLIGLPEQIIANYLPDATAEQLARIRR